MNAGEKIFFFSSSLDNGYYLRVKKLYWEIIVGWKITNDVNVNSKEDTEKRRWSFLVDLKQTARLYTIYTSHTRGYFIIHIYLCSFCPFPLQGFSRHQENYHSQGSSLVCNGITQGKNLKSSPQAQD